MGSLQVIQDGADAGGVLAKPGQRQGRVNGEGAIQVEPPAWLGTLRLQSAAGGGAVRQTVGASLTWPAARDQPVIARTARL